MNVARVMRHVRPAHVLVRLEATSRDEAVRELAQTFSASGALAEGQSGALASQVLAREVEGTTGIGGGVAVPHAKTALAKDLLVAVGVSPEGVDFQSVDGDRVHVIFLIASPPDAAQEYLALMRWIVTLTRSKTWMKLVRAAATPDALVEVLEDSSPSK